MPKLPWPGGVSGVCHSSVVALTVGVAQILFLINIFWSAWRGRDAGGNPWHATTLEWQTPETPPGHGNFGKELPVVYRWAYVYNVPGAMQDYIPQNQPPFGVRPRSAQPER